MTQQLAQFPSKVVDLKTSEGSEYFYTNHSKLNHVDFGTIVNFIKKNKFNYKYGNIPIFHNGTDASRYHNLVKNNKIYEVYSYNCFTELINHAVRLQSTPQKQLQSAGLYFQGVLVPNNKSQFYFPIINGDSENSIEAVLSNGTAPVDLTINEIAHVTISFNCLRRFANETIHSVANRLISKEIELVDYTQDENICLSKSDWDKCKAWVNKKSGRTPCPINPPQFGFTLIGSPGRKWWHRSATTLFYDNKNKYTILLGQDEGTYFGCQLKDNPKSIKSAYSSLTPKEAKVVGVKRQGEWFAVPVKKAPEIKERLAESVTELCLPLDHKDGSHHTIISDNICVGKDGLIYAKNASVEHPDHQTLKTEGWVVYHRNTAIRSFSVEGVD